MRNISLLVLVFLLTSGTAFARFGTEGPQYFPPTGGPLIVDISTRPEAPEGSVSSNTPPREIPREVRQQIQSQTQNGIQRDRLSSSTLASTSRPMPVKTAIKVLGTPGVVSSLGSDSFTLTIPAGKGKATTTVTVRVTSTTKYNRASSTVAFSDIAVGSRVEVLGKISTSAKTITAERVILGSEIKKEAQPREGFLNRVKGFILGKPSSDSDSFKANNSGEDGNNPAAAVEANSFMGGFFHKIFSWF